MAELENFQQAQLQIEGDPEPLKCLFNPKEYTITKSSTWNPSKVAGASLPKVQYGGGAPQELSFEILLDDLEGSREIQPDIDRLFMAMEADRRFTEKSGKGKPTSRPPKLTFSWGATLSFAAALKSLSAQFVRFSPKGQPIRAQLKLTLIQLERTDSRSGRGALPGTNPTTRGLPELGTRTVRDGDSLQSIAFDAYGDPTSWRAIAEANDIDDPMRLRRGTRITVPRLI
jgi:nucleoid-associated protein YgaU